MQNHASGPSRQSSSDRPVLILGAGINGCALARELILNDVNVWLVDTADVASGATSGSSRLIHGGLRYLEYGEFDLVKESLGERTRLLRLAPQFVHPLRLWIPAENRFGGMLSTIGRFFQWNWWPQSKRPRGSELIRAGLFFYDTYAKDQTVPRHTCGPSHLAEAPRVDQQRYRHLCSYYDGQVPFPERLVLSMLEDATQVACERGLDFRVLNYHKARLSGRVVEILPCDSQGDRQAISLEPALIINATGAWVDETLHALQVSAERLMGGTKGSHLFSFSPRLKELLAGQGIYAEASDGRPIFITPLADTVLIGTTDMAFSEPPENARATPAEIQYLIDSTNHILPDGKLRPEDIAFHYSAVRPLPYSNANTTAAITRRHFVVEHQHAEVPVCSIVGGKLTTMRSLAEQGAADVLRHLGRQPVATSRERLFPGAANYPATPDAIQNTQAKIAEQTGFARQSIAAVWTLCGTQCEQVLANVPPDQRDILPDTFLPEAYVRHVITHEHVQGLGDLVQRRLMLLYHERLTRRCLVRLAELLQASGKLAAQQQTLAVDNEIQSLAERYAKTVCG